MEQTPTLVLSQPRLATFLICRRRFQLRYLERLPWPIMPVASRERLRVELGQRFHQLLERHFLGLPVDEATLDDAQLLAWWHQFRQSRLQIPAGRRLTEHRLTIAVDGHFLVGRFDLVVVGGNEGVPAAHIYDWKTGQPQPVEELREDWQTRLYLAMLVEGGSALLGHGQALDPANVQVTYWYVNEPLAPRVIRYDQAQHARNWSEIRQVIGAIDAALAADEWPLTDDWSHCRVCAFQIYCRREAAGTLPATIAEEPPAYLIDPAYLLEPETP